MARVKEVLPLVENATGSSSGSRPKPKNAASNQIWEQKRFISYIHKTNVQGYKQQGMLLGAHGTSMLSGGSGEGVSSRRSGKRREGSLQSWGDAWDEVAGHPQE